MKKNFVLLLSISIIFLIIALAAPSNVKKTVESENVGTSINPCAADDLSGNFYSGESLAFYDGEKIDIPKIASGGDHYSVLGTSSGDKWIEVDLSEQKLVARDGESIFLETPVSTGLPGTPTPTGEFRIWIKLRYAKMEGGVGRYYYNLPNVPYVMYFSNSEVPSYKGYGLHGAYWHNSFGTRRSHGCVNLPIPVAEKLYYWTTPNIPDGKNTVKSTGENQGTRILIHD